MRVNMTINAHSDLVPNVANHPAMLDSKGTFAIKPALQSNNHSVTTFTTLAKHSLSMYSEHKPISDLMMGQKYAQANVEAIKARKSVPNGI